MDDMNKSIERIKATVDGLIYLASPYSHDQAAIRQWRFDVACKAAACLMRDGLAIFSPIAHSHVIAQHGLPKGWDFWEPYDRLLLGACGGMIVLTMPGWNESKGIIAELQIAAESYKPIWFLSARGNRWPEGDIMNHDTDWSINP